MMIHLLDSVMLTVDLPDVAHEFAPGHGLVAGDRGAVVAVFTDPPGYLVEIFRDGKTIALVDVTPDQVRAAPPALPAHEPAQRTAD
jgi:hypothetical protein